jgi:hypothetical protein
MCCAGGPRGEDALRHVDEYEGISSLMSAPSGSVLTACDEEHLVTYLRLLDADVEGVDWREVARVVLHLDPEHESDHARRTFESHLSRAKWMTEHGYRLLLRGGTSA